MEQKNMDNVWRHCGSCKGPIELSSTYYACSISSCRKTAYCSVPCFDDHIPVLRHKDAWAEERIAPKEAEAPAPLSRLDSARIAPSNTVSALKPMPREILIVGSKLKDYIRARSDLNTSAAVLERLSDMVRILCDHAIERAHNDNRKTVMDRDFSF
jgi:hypothetical protein